MAPALLPITEFQNLALVKPETASQRPEMITPKVAQDLYEEAQWLEESGLIADLPEILVDADGYTHVQPAANLVYQLRIYQDAQGVIGKCNAARYLSWLLGVIDDFLASRS